MKKLIVVSVIVAFLSVASLASAKGPGVVASHSKASTLAGAKCRSLHVTFEFGIPLLDCDTWGADFCHIPGYNRQQVFCMGYFWLYHHLGTPGNRWEFCSRIFYFRRSKYGKPKITKPIYKWDCTLPGFGPPNIA